MKANRNIRFKTILFSVTLMLTASFVLTAQERKMETQNQLPPPSPKATAASFSLPSIDVEYLKVIQGVKYSIPVVDYLFTHVNEIPAFSDNLFEAFAKSLHNVPALFHCTNSIISAKAGGYGPPLSGTWRGKTIKTEADIDEFFELKDVAIVHPEEWSKLPFSFRKGIMEFLIYVDRAKTSIDQYVQPIVSHLKLQESDSRKDVFEKLMGPWHNRELGNWATIEAIQLADEKKLSYASRLASEKLIWFFSQSNASIPDDFAGCSITSCMGELVVNGTGNDTITGNKFCVIELGGDDVYLGNTASPVSIQQPAGIVIDLRGNDKYLGDDDFLISGVLGLAFLIDMEGDDTYQTNQPGLAFSLYGTSLLYDFKGDDVYSSNGAYAQASSYVGTALFIDVSGKDKYVSSSYSQGFGGTKGVAVFYDGSGNDYYNIEKSNISNKAGQQSFVQGAAKGRWAEATDGQSLAGGIGIFFDNSGADKYKANSFSQGASYYFGLGIFSDKEGNDTYNANSHSQGYAGHYSLASFIEKHGDDSYNSETDKEKITQIIGGGRDNSVGLFIDYYGDDNYNFGNRSAGIGDLNGIGLLKDLDGNDTYIWHKNRMNAGSSSLGKTIEEGFGMGLTFKIIQHGNHARGLFYDSNGDKTKN
jgi:hypothetical protein